MTFIRQPSVVASSDGFLTKTQSDGELVGHRDTQAELFRINISLRISPSSFFQLQLQLSLQNHQSVTQLQQREHVQLSKPISSAERVRLPNTRGQYESFCIFISG